MVIWDRSAHGWAITGFIAAVILGIAAAVAIKSDVILVFLAAGSLWYYLFMRRSFNRRRLSNLPIPAGWRDTLEQKVGFYRALSPERKIQFERDVAVFIGENTFTAIAPAEATDELKVLAAASAVMLLFGRPERDYPRVSEILFYPEAFDDEYRTGGEKDVAGLTHPFGAVVLSVPWLLKSFANENDGYHVGLHEFAHLLDLSGQQFDGVPLEIDPSLFQRWCDRIRTEMKRAGRRSSALRDYAKTNEAECFAVAVEVFFERPETLKKCNPELHEMLQQYFEPAA